MARTNRQHSAGHRARPATRHVPGIQLEAIGSTVVNLPESTPYGVIARSV